jgi:hypothetical protein
MVKLLKALLIILVAQIGQAQHVQTCTIFIAKSIKCGTYTL